MKKEFIDKILNGEKIWEIRRTNTRYRGKIALIAGGKVFGVVDLVDSFKIPVKELLKKEQFHRGGDFLKEYARNREFLYVWVLKNPRKLSFPLHINLPRGVRIWVNLNEEERKKIMKYLERS